MATTAGFNISTMLDSIAAFTPGSSHRHAAPGGRAAAGRVVRGVSPRHGRGARRRRAAAPTHHGPPPAARPRQHRLLPCVTCRRHARRAGGHVRACSGGHALMWASCGVAWRGMCCWGVCCSRLGPATVAGHPPACCLLFLGGRAVTVALARCLSRKGGRGGEKPLTWCIALHANASAKDRQRCGARPPLPLPLPRPGDRPLPAPDASMPC
jgi:hypothetical protein